MYTLIECPEMNAHVLVVVGLLVVAGPVACSSDDGSSVDAASEPDVTQLDAAIDVGDEAVPAQYSLSVTPTHVTEDPRDSFPITVTLTRDALFQAAVTITVENLPSGVTASPLVITGTSGTFSLGADATAVATGNDVLLHVVGTAGAQQASAPLTLRVGSLLTPTAGAYLVSTFATTLDVEVWGGGGGGGYGSANTAGSGGGGGFAFATIPVTGGETLVAEEGSGGAAGNSPAGGAGGGGLSGLRRGSTYLIVAGGGGGGATIGMFGFPSSGGGGGGTSGGSSPQGGFGGTQTSGGAAGGMMVSGTAGSSLQGGNAPSPNASGGVVGGGSGGYDATNKCGGGGGGGGWFGGGGGGTIDPFMGCSGGGGGSGYADPGDTNVVSSVGGSPTCAHTSNADFLVGACVGGAASTAGSKGLVVVRLSKP